MSLHIRPLKPDEPEMVPEDEIEYVQLHDGKGNELNEWIHFEPGTGKAIKGPKPKTKKLIPTGSMKQVDEKCSDCGSTLVNGTGRNFRHMVCARINPADPRFVAVSGTKTNAKGRVVPAIVPLHDPGAPQPQPNTVIECGRYGLDG